MALNSSPSTQFGQLSLTDTMQFDGLTDAFERVAMGESTDGYNAEFEITREQQDEFAAASHARLVRAQADGTLDDEIVPITTPGGVVKADETIRRGTTPEKLGGLKAVFETPELSERFPQVTWSTTAGNSS